LAVGTGKGGAFFNEGIDVGCADMGVAQRVQGVRALLIGANPKDIGLIGHVG